jgi:DNA-binding NtrC family response regulator
MAIWPLVVHTSARSHSCFYGRPPETVMELPREYSSTRLIATTFVADSPVMQSTLARVATLARARRTTLITGPTGSGKEIIARMLHDAGQAPGTPYVVVHCGTLPDHLAEAELFGHTRGAFTGALGARSGLVRTASGGTLFLDEVDSLTPNVQTKLLRFLEHGEFRSVGSDRTERAHSWVIAATNHDLNDGVRRGEFRADLLYRLEVMRIDVPPLRVRGADIELLAQHFLGEVVGTARTFSHSALMAIRRYHWPGNVRELKHCVERAALLGDHAIIEPEDLGLDDIAAPPPALVSSPGDLGQQLWNMIERDGLSLGEAVARCEHAIISAALNAEHGNRTRAADRLGIHLRTIFKKLRKA